MAALIAVLSLSASSFIDLLESMTTTRSTAGIFVLPSSTPVVGPAIVANSSFLPLQFSSPPLPRCAETAPSCHGSAVPAVIPWVFSGAFHALKAKRAAPPSAWVKLRVKRFLRLRVPTIGSWYQNAVSLGPRLPLAPPSKWAISTSPGGPSYVKQPLPWTEPSGLRTRKV